GVVSFWIFSNRRRHRPPVDRCGAAAGSGGSETGLEGGGSLEAHRLGRCDFHRFAGLRVAALAGGALLHLAGAEADDLDFLVLLDALLDGTEDGGKGVFGGALGGVFAEGFLNGFNKFCFVHGEDGIARAPLSWQVKMRSSGSRQA